MNVSRASKFRSKKCGTALEDCWTLTVRELQSQHMVTKDKSLQTHVKGLVAHRSTHV